MGLATGCTAQLFTAHCTLHTHFRFHVVTSFRFAQLTRCIAVTNWMLPATPELPAGRCVVQNVIPWHGSVVSNRTAQHTAHKHAQAGAAGLPAPK